MDEKRKEIAIPMFHRQVMSAYRSCLTLFHLRKGLPRYDPEYLRLDKLMEGELETYNRFTQKIVDALKGGE